MYVIKRNNTNSVAVGECQRFRCKYKIREVTHRYNSIESDYSIKPIKGVCRYSLQAKLCPSPVSSLRVVPARHTNNNRENKYHKNVFITSIVYLMVFPVRILIQFGTGLFCFILTPKVRFTRKDFWDGYRNNNNLAHQHQTSMRPTIFTKFNQLSFVE